MNPSATQNPKSAIPAWRWFLTLLTGLIVWTFSKALAAGIATSLLGGELTGTALALYAVMTLTFVSMGFHFTQRIAKSSLRDLGLRAEHWQKDALIGAGVGVLFFVVQFALIIPNTGGALREDVIASRELMGGTFAGLISGIVVGWLVGGYCEELFFRGFLITNLHHLFGDTRWGLWIGILFSVFYFALGHAYQGWVGIIDVGIGALIWTGLFLWRGRLTVAMVGHGVWDMLAFIGLYLWYS